MANPLKYDEVKAAVAGTAAAFRCVTEYQAAGGPGDKVFPPTYEGGKYAVETRMVDGQVVDCVLLDSVQSQANRMELALLETHRSEKLKLPLLVAKFNHGSLKKKFDVTSLDAPHRAADAIFRDCLLNGVMFRQSDKGRILDAADIRNATGLFGLCPTALVFGLWDSTGPRGGLGAKFQRALVSEIVGYVAMPGVKTVSRIDPLQIQKAAGPIFRARDGESWTTDPDSALEKDGKKVLWAKSKKGEDVLWNPTKDQDEGRPSKINHGNITPSFVDSETKQNLPGGFTINKAVQTTVLSLAALRRLRFPLNGATNSDATVDVAGRAALAALGIAAATLARSDGDLRSRCQLFPLKQPVWELLDVPGEAPKQFSLTPDQAVELLKTAIEKAKDAKLPWEGEIELTPSDELIELVRRSQELASAEGGEAE